MALELSVTADLLRQKTNIESQIILEIQGVDLVFGAISVTKFAEYGDNIFYGDEGLFYGGTSALENSRDYISFNGTTNQIAQQIDPTKEGATSVQRIKIRLIDKDRELTNLFSPNFGVDEILGKRAQVYLAFKGGAHPFDSVRILSGIIDNIDFGAGFIEVSIAHPEQLKRANIFEQLTRQLTAPISNSATTIPFTTDNFLLPADVCETYVRIDDEIIRYSELTPTGLINVSRGQFGTIAEAHDEDADVTTLYRIQGNPIELSLKLMLSGGDEYYSIDNKVFSIRFSPEQTVPNGLFFTNLNLANEKGLTVGDFVTIENADNPSNNFTKRTIVQILQSPVYLILIVDGAPLVDEIDTNVNCKFASRFNVLPDGAQLDPTLVDVGRHIFWQQIFNQSFAQYDFMLDETIDCKEFLEKEVYFPCGFFPVPRAGRASVSYSIPPLALESTPILNEDVVKSPKDIKMTRSTNKNFFNSVIYRYEEDRLEAGKFRQGKITLSQNSLNRIKTKNTPLIIESKGLRADANVDNFTRRQSSRFLDRYQFAAESTKIRVKYKEGFAIEVSDIVVFGSEALQISDITQGNRNFAPRLMEVVNKTLNIKTGDVTLDLIDSGVGINGRFGVISPTSKVSTGSTTNRIFLEKGFNTGEFELETDKWRDYIREEIEVHNVDYTQTATVNLLEIDPSFPNTLIVTDLPFAPDDTFFVDMPRYPLNQDPKEIRKWKDIHCFLGLEVPVLSGISNTEFEIPLSFVDDFFVGAVVRVHNADFSIDSTPNVEFQDAQVTDISGQIITVNRDLGFTPASNFICVLIGFRDKGFPYRYI